MSVARNLTRKLLGDHLLEGDLVAGEVNLAVDQILIEDATRLHDRPPVRGARTGPDLRPARGHVRGPQRLADRRQEHGRAPLPAVFLGTLRYPLLPPGNGISHYVHLERFARPGELLVGADSHSTMAGALGMFAVGAGGLDVAVAMAGHGFSLECPKVVGVELRGKLPAWVQSKDIILELLETLRGAWGRGEGLRVHRRRSLGAVGDGSGTICNMITELGATSRLPLRRATREWLEAQRREDDYVPLAADSDASYDETEVIELAELEPLIAKPTSPGNVVPVREVAGTGTVQVCVGSSVNSSYEDLATAAAVLRENVVDPRIEMTVTPGSRQILDTISRSGVYQDLVAAGARMLEPVCGPCIGVGQAPSAGVPSVRTFNRNFGPQRDERRRGLSLLARDGRCDRAQGEISDPRELGAADHYPAPSDPNMDDRQILAPPPPEEARSRDRPRPQHRAPARGRAAPRSTGGTRRHSRRRRRLDRGHGSRRGFGYEPLVEHTRVREVHVSPAGPEFHDRALSGAAVSSSAGTTTGRAPAASKPPLRPCTSA